jgi:hypothetical protein
MVKESAPIYQSTNKPKTKGLMVKESSPINQSTNKPITISP